ncbi:MAG: chemotaxis protein CheA [Pseudomonadales bacterium]
MSMEEFHQIFFEEADELMEAMEAELLEMVFEPDNPERINNVFRAAHSIKGGAATFGFAEITETTHVMETLMNEVREGAIAVDRSLVDVLLSAADCVKDLLAAVKGGGPADAGLAVATRTALEACLERSGAAPQTSPPQPDSSDEDAAAAETGAALRRYRIGFRPAHGLFRTGNDPLHILRALRELGDLEVEVDTGSVPTLDGFRADQLYLAWTLHIATGSDPEVVLEAFEWVEDLCEIDFQEVESRPEATPDDAPAAVPAAAPAGAPAVPMEAGSAAGTERRSADAGTLAAGTAERPDSAPHRGERRAAGAESATIRVGIDKIDTLINLVGELVITQSMLSDLGEDVELCDLDKLREGFQQLERHTRALQESVMKIRMVPISNVFNRMPRTVHDLTARLGKQLDLVMHGEHTELDKTLMERIGDPLVHLVRNAVDHGVEMPEVRAAHGKPERGTLTLSAFHAGGDVVIEISDDGAGLDTERIRAKARDRGLVDAGEQLDEAQVHQLIFHPGFSTAEEVSDVSGRGVGMDVVRQNILGLGGSVEIASDAGRGSTFTIRLPLTLAIVDAQLLQVAGQIYAVPLVSIVESFQVERANLKSIAERGQLYRVRDDYVPVVDLTSLFGIREATPQPVAGGLLVLVESGNGRMGLLVDDLLAQQQVVIKSLESNFRAVPGVSGATILGDGRVALIVDVTGLARLLRATGGRRGQDGGLTGIRAA